MPFNALRFVKRLDKPRIVKRLDKPKPPSSSKENDGFDRAINRASSLVFGRR